MVQRSTLMFDLVITLRQLGITHWLAEAQRQPWEHNQRVLATGFDAHQAVERISALTGLPEMELKRELMV